MLKYNFKSDFDFLVAFRDTLAGTTDWPDYDWEGRFWTTNPFSPFTASSIGGKCSNCYCDDGRMHIVCANHNLRPGRLFYEIAALLPSAIYPRGMRRVVASGTLDIELVEGNGDEGARLLAVVGIPFAIEALQQSLQSATQNLQQSLQSTAEQFQQSLQTSTEQLQQSLDQTNASIPQRILYDDGTHRLVLQDVGGGEVSAVELPLSTAASDGLMSAQQAAAAQYLKDLGTFESKDDACAAAARIENCSAKGVTIFTFRAKDDWDYFPGMIVQCANSWCKSMQWLFWGDKVWRRDITGANGVDDHTPNAFPWELAMPQKIEYDQQNRKIILRDYENEEVCSAVIPLASSGVAGLYPHYARPVVGIHYNYATNTVSLVGRDGSPISSTTLTEANEARAGLMSAASLKKLNDASTKLEDVYTKSEVEALIAQAIANIGQ